MERIGALVYRLHIKDTHAFHPGGTNIYFVGDPDEEMILVDTGEHDRQWTGDILEAHRELGKPRMTAIVITHGHGDHIGGSEILQTRFGAQVVMGGPDWDLVEKYPNRFKTMAPKRNITATDGAQIPVTAQ